MFFPPRNIVESVKKEYPSGTRVELVSMNAPYRDMPTGTRGTVDCVDDTGTIHVIWDNGYHLGVVYGEDSCRKIHTTKTICYGKKYGTVKKIKSNQQKRACPICGQTYNEPPCSSRVDGKTKICPDSGKREALYSIEVCKAQM